MSRDLGRRTAVDMLVLAAIEHCCFQHGEQVPYEDVDARLRSTSVDLAHAVGRLLSLGLIAHHVKCGQSRDSLSGTRVQVTRAGARAIFGRGFEHVKHYP